MRTHPVVALTLTLLLGCSQTVLEPQSEPLGRQSAEIVGGVTEPAHWYVVMVGDSSGGFCTGTLISKRTVLTAGHCAGGISRIYFDRGSPVTRSSVNAIQTVRHPQYHQALTNDLSLVKLAADAPVQPVPILREPMTNTADFLGPMFSFVGYGDTNGSGSGFGTRRVVAFPIYGVGPMNIPEPTGAPKGAVTSIDSSEWYYRWPNKNTCFGDSGGPAFVVRQGVERHAGATSYGDDACIYDGVQARTDSTTLAWIQQTIDAFEPGDPCRADGVCGAGCFSTTPTPLGTLTDPDCADAHCAADGICVLSCSPVDPDCSTLNINNCAENGVCQPSGCAVPDKDCQKANGAACALGGECQSGFCVDNMCCSTACNGACEACSVAAGGSQNGLCLPRATGTVCRASTGVCDAAEKCDGAKGTCPNDVVASASTVCRAATGTCDAEERCTGTSNACPPDELKPSTTVCRAATGVCDAAETCSGTSAECPADAFAGPTVVCRAANGACDAEETCTGTSNACPADGVKPANAVCRAAAGDCDAEETCDGSSVACPVDVLKPATAVCRAAAGACDAPETCTGTATACPADGFLAASTVCRAAAGECDQAESCSGAAAQCPADEGKADGTSCAAGQCTAGVCKAPVVPDGGTLLPDGGVAPPTPNKGCGCGASGAEGALQALGVLAAGALLRRRRGRNRA